MSETPLYPNPWDPADEAEWSPITKTWRFVKKYPNPPELEKYLYAGKLSQKCEYCGHIEPAGAFCHECSRQVDPSKSWFKPQALDENGKPRRGRPSKAPPISA
jgi:hypothetical protein